MKKKFTGCSNLAVLNFPQNTRNSLMTRLLYHMYGRLVADVEVKVTYRQAKWQETWTISENGRVTYAIFTRVRTRRLQDDVYPNQVLSGHGAFGDTKIVIFRKYVHLSVGNGRVRLDTVFSLSDSLCPLTVSKGEILPQELPDSKTVGFKSGQLQTKGSENHSQWLPHLDIRLETGSSKGWPIF